MTAKSGLIHKLIEMLRRWMRGSTGSKTRVQPQSNDKRERGVFAI